MKFVYCQIAIGHVPIAHLGLSCNGTKLDRSQVGMGLSWDGAELGWGRIGMGPSWDGAELG